MAKKRKGTRKEREARKKLLSEPWWKLLDIKVLISIITVLLMIIGFVAVN
ncbi:hypothetical protein [Amphritea balenae]|nr:hypothetical protein [Amphritea balenae]